MTSNQDAVPATANSGTKTQLRFWTTVWRAIRLRCPHCGQGRIFVNYFRMHPRCSTCGLRFQREPGYFLGSIYFNYGVTAMIVTAGYLGCLFGTNIPTQILLPIFGAWCLLFPLWFFRYARSLWLGFDRYFDVSSDEARLT